MTQIQETRWYLISNVQFIDQKMYRTLGQTVLALPDVSSQRGSYIASCYACTAAMNSSERIMMIVHDDLGGRLLRLLQGISKIPPCSTKDRCLRLASMRWDPIRRHHLTWLIVQMQCEQRQCMLRTSLPTSPPPLSSVPLRALKAAAIRH